MGDATSDDGDALKQVMAAIVEKLEELTTE